MTNDLTEKTRCKGAIDLAIRASREGLELDHIAQILRARKFKWGRGPDGWTADDVERLLKM